MATGQLHGYRAGARWLGSGAPRELSRGALSLLFKRYAEGLGGKKPLTIHQIRHTFGSERAGQMDAMILRDLMGHKSLRTTQQHAQVNGEAVKKAFWQFDRRRR